MSPQSVKNISVLKLIFVYSNKLEINLDSHINSLLKSEVRTRNPMIYHHLVCLRLVRNGLIQYFPMHFNFGAFGRVDLNPSIYR